MNQIVNEQQLLAFADTVHKKVETTNLYLRAVLAEVARRAQPFGADCAPGQFITPRGARGIVRWIHNPTAAPLQISLYDGGNANGPAKYSSTLAPGASDHVFLVFRTGLFCSVGAGGQVHGEYDA